MQRRIFSIKWYDFIPNVTVAATSDLDSIINIARARQLALLLNFIHHQMVDTKEET